MSVSDLTRRPRRAFMASTFVGGTAAAIIGVTVSMTGTHVGNPLPNQATHGHEMSSVRPTTRIRPISCERLPDTPGKSITTVVVEFPPGAYSPRHRHPGSVVAFVLAGTVRSQLLGSPAEVFTAGGTWFEPPGAVHLFAENASMSEPASLLATFVTTADCGPLTIPD